MGAVVSMRGACMCALQCEARACSCICGVTSMGCSAAAALIAAPRSSLTSLASSVCGEHP